MYLVTPQRSGGRACLLRVGRLTGPIVDAWSRGMRVGWITDRRSPTGAEKIVSSFGRIFFAELGRNMSGPAFCHRAAVLLLLLVLVFFHLPTSRSLPVPVACWRSDRRMGRFEYRYKYQSYRPVLSLLLNSYCCP